MALAGVFTGQQGKSDIPLERPFIKTSQINAAPASMSDFLYAADPSLDILLNEDKLADELLAAGKLTDVVNSRLSLSRLRSLRGEAANLSALVTKTQQ